MELFKVTYLGDYYFFTAVNLDDAKRKMETLFNSVNFMIQKLSEKEFCYKCECNKTEKIW